jgi:hypothetical protein
LEFESVGILIVLAIIGKRVFLNSRSTGMGVGRREMDQSRDCGDRRSRTGIRSPTPDFRTAFRTAVALATVAADTDRE